MVLPATTSSTLTAQSIQAHHDQRLADEILNAESVIQRAISIGQYEVLFHSFIIGNPPIGGDINNNASLTSDQISFRDAMIAAGYRIKSDITNGLWKIEWNLANTLAINIYMVKTTVSPVNISTSTNTLIVNSLLTLSPIVNASSSLSIINGGNFNETSIGLTNQAIYEYVVIAKQQNDTTDHSSTILSALVSGSLGYNNSNINVGKAL